MDVGIPTTPFAGFVALTALTYVVALFVLLRTSQRLMAVAGILALWIGLTGTLASLGFFQDFAATPPRIPLFVFFDLAGLCWLVFLSPWKAELQKTPQWLLIGAQAFRVPLELLIADLASRQLMPVEMSFHGRNFDIVSGLSAPLVAWLVARRGESASKGVVIVWNLCALLLATNVVVHGMLSVPYPFQKLHLSADNIAVAYFPVIWLPFFLVPMAYGLHLVSLRKALARQ